MTILLFLFGVAVAAGLFFILADILKLPRLSTEKALCLLYTSDAADD